MRDKNISPIGWYICSYLLRFIELASEENFNLEAKFLSWENFVLIKANSIDEAYEKAVAIASRETEPYKGGPEGVDVQWVFEGMTSVVPVYEELADGSEIMWQERSPRKLKNLQALISQKHEFYQ
jgi:hypothetical protein